MYKLLGRATSGNVQKVIFLFKELGLPFDRVDYGRQFENTSTPDYLAIGSDTDWVCVPLDPVSAQLVADRFDCILPTARICQAIYSQATQQTALSRDYYLPDKARRTAKPTNSGSSATPEAVGSVIRMPASSIGPPATAS